METLVGFGMIGLLVLFVVKMATKKTKFPDDGKKIPIVGLRKYIDL